MPSHIASLTHSVLSCAACPRLRVHCETVAKEKKRAFKDQKYWGKPVPGFGDPHAELVIVGLAPAAHGANRTGRIFTGDRSGEWLYRALHRAGFANQPQSIDRNDGLELKRTFITCVLKCAPPDNKPASDEMDRCTELHLKSELTRLQNCRVYLALGQIALKGLWPLIATVQSKRPKFIHGASFSLPNQKWLVMSYHPSQQNTFTGRLTEPMFDSVFEKVTHLLR